MLPSHREDRGRAEEELSTLFAQNAYAILWRKAEEAADTWSVAQFCEDAPTVTRDIVSIDLDADKGPPVEARASLPGAPPVAVPVTGDNASAVAYAQAIRAPVPSRYPQAAFPATIPRQHGHQGSHSSATRSPATIGGGENASYGFQEDDSDTTLFLRYLWRHAELYGLTRQPVSTSRRPMMSGTITAKQLVELELHEAVGHTGGGRTAVGDGGCPNGIGVEDDDADSTAKETPVCTFVLTTQDEVDRVPEHESDESDRSASNSKERAAENKTLDVLLFVISGTRSTSYCSTGRSVSVNFDVCRSAALRTGVPLHEAGDWPVYETEGRSRSGPGAKEVAEQTKILVERLLRVAVAHRRKDRVWWLFKNAMVALARRKSATNQAPRTPCTLAAAGASRAPDCLPRAPSPASPHPWFDFRGGVRTARCGLDDGPSPICESDLRHLLEFSTVTPLGVADPALSEFFDLKHSVDWSGWFQHLVDSPYIFTLDFGGRDDAAQVSSSSDAPAGAAESPAASATTAIGVDGPRDASATRTDCDSGATRRVLLALPRSDAPGIRDSVAAAHGDGGDLATVVNEDWGGEGPWVGTVGGAARASPVSSEAPSVFFYVALDKVSDRPCTSARYWQ